MISVRLSSYEFFGSLASEKFVRFAVEAGYSLKDVQTIVKRPPTSIQYLIDQTLPPYGVKGRKRLFSLADMVLIVAAQTLFDRGFKAPAASALAKAAGEHFEALLLDDNAQRWIFAAPHGGGYVFTVTADAAEGLSIIEAAPDAHVINVRRTLHEAMGRIIDAMEGASSA
jgi:hypothetical protein